MTPLGELNANELCRKGKPDGNGRPCQTDNKDLTLWRQNTLEAADRNRVKWVIDDQYAPTDLVTSWPGSASYTGDSETDIVYQELNPTNPRYVGVTWCDDPISATVKCDQAYVRIKGGARFTYAVICHETGHAVGLLHGRDANPPINDGDDRLGCLHNPPDNGPIELGSNNRDQINKTY
ncbi:hypothetical protein [Streptomyces chartreusis]|uniref:hypothetical protein n=1 Tax=Streptomyces chartreusis TaxID=1969 RepID=UPI0037989C7C